MQVPSNLFKTFLLAFQQKCIKSLERFEATAKFQQDFWQHNSTVIKSGTCNSCVLNGGNTFAKAGVNFSHVFGKHLPPSALQNRNDKINQAFEAMGVSIVIHPVNPYVPTSHANLRLFITENNDCNKSYWFGGGFDLTPYYGFMDDCVAWHTAAYNACEPFGKDLYSKFKEACDEYFYLPHRQEPRGIGGIFFDNLILGDFENSMQFMEAIGEAYIATYTDLVDKRYTHPYAQQHIDFQAYRRGRYVEFNLLYDRGTLFGLQSGGRTESILMSLPPEVHWKYNVLPKDGSEEQKLYNFYLQKRNWI